MSYLKKKNRTFLQRILAGCHSIALLGLALSVMLVLAVTVLSMLYEEIPIPHRLMDRIDQHLEEQGLSFACEKVTFDFKGNLLAHKAALSFINSDEPVLQADLVYLNINLAPLMLNRMSIGKIRISNATLYCPAMVSPSGATEPLAQDLNFALRRRWLGWNMPYLTGKFRGLQISASGDLPGMVPQLLEQGREREAKPDLYLEYLKRSSQVVEASKFLNGLDAPHLDMEFFTHAIRGFTVKTQLATPHFSSTSWPSADNITYTGFFQLAPDIRLLEPVRIAAQSMAVADPEIYLQNVSIAASRDGPIEDLRSPFPLRFEAAASTLTLRDNPVRNLAITGSLLDDGTVEGKVMAETFGGLFTSQVWADTKTREARGKARGHFNSEAIVHLRHFDRLPKLRWSKQSQPAFFDLDFSYPGNLDGLEVGFRMETRDLELIKAPFQWARLRGQMKGTQVNVPLIDVGGYGNDLQCSFRQDLREKYFRFSMAGNFRPHDVNAWWGNWWQETFEHLGIANQPPFLDLAVRNSFHYKKQLTLHGYASGEKVAVNSMSFDRIAAKMFVRPNYVDVYELKAFRAESSASGQFQFELKKGDLQYILVDATSDLDPELTLGIFGEGVRRILHPYTWEERPTLTVRGEFNYSEPTHWQELEIGIATDAPMTYYGFPIDSLNVRARYDRGDVYLHELDFGFAKGSGTGSASYIRQDDDAFLLYDLELTEAQLGQALEMALQFRRNRGSDQLEEERDVGDYKGALDIRVSGMSPANYGLDRVFAQGDVQIRGGTLAEIPLFGPLSSLIPFTKLRLGDASLFFTWDEGKISFPDLVLKGSTARLTGAGDYYPNGSYLDFNVRVFLFQDGGIPILSQLIRPILDPLSYIAVVNLTGTLTNPRWQFILNPLSSLSSKTIPPPLEPLDLEYDFNR